MSSGFGIHLAAGGSRRPGLGLPWPRPALALAGCSQQQQELELCLFHDHGGAHTQKQAVRARMASREWRRMWRRVSEGVVSPSGCPKREMEHQHMCSNGGGAHWCMAATRQFIEHVVCSEVAKVGRQFGPFLGRIGPWAKNEVCLSRRALQL